MNGSCRVNASAALQDGWSSSFTPGAAISGKSSVTVGKRHFPFRLFAEFFGCPSMNWPLEALLPKSSQYSTRAFKTHLSIARRAFRVSTQPMTKSTSEPFLTCWIVACMPCQFSPQKRLIRWARTIAFGKPISVRQNGWRTQLVSLTVSGSIRAQLSLLDVQRRGGLDEGTEALTR